MNKKVTFELDSWDRAEITIERNRYPESYRGTKRMYAAYSMVSPKRYKRVIYAIALVALGTWTEEVEGE